MDVAAKTKPDELGLNKPNVVTIDTFDNFNYMIKVGQKTNDNFPLTMTVAAQISKERAPGKDEKPEDKDKLDKEFKEKQKKLEEKLAQEKGFENWIYLVSTWTVDALLKERSHLLVEKKEEPKKDDAKKEEAKPKGPNKDAKPAPADSSAKPDSKETNAPPATEAKPEAK